MHEDEWPAIEGHLDTYTAPTGGVRRGLWSTSLTTMLGIESPAVVTVKSFREHGTIRTFVGTFAPPRTALW